MSILDRFESKFKKDASGCWLWTACKTHNGYGAIQVDGKKRGAHRVSFELYVSPIPAGMFVCHTCDNKACVNPEHLFIGSPKDNIRDMFNKGRENKACGEAVAGAKLTAEDVRWIRQLGAPQWKIARCFGVTQPLISKIKAGHWWKHV